MEHGKKKQKKVERKSPTRSEEGYAWVYACIKRYTYFFVAFVVGKWTQQTCKNMVYQLYRRTELPSPDKKLDIFTDENDDYTYFLAKYYTDTCIDYGQLIKIKKKGKLVGKEKRTIYGSPKHEDFRDFGYGC